MIDIAAVRMEITWVPFLLKAARKNCVVADSVSVLLAEGHPSCCSCGSSILMYLSFLSGTSGSRCKSKKAIRKIWEHATSISTLNAELCGTSWLLRSHFHNRNARSRSSEMAIGVFESS